MMCESKSGTGDVFFPGKLTKTVFETVSVLANSNNFGVLNLNFFFFVKASFKKSLYTC